METKIIVLVHGGGFGAWCWYKTISLLEDSGFKVNAIDLTGSGIHSSDTNKISSLPEYAEPLTSYLKGLGDAETVCSLSILVITIFWEYLAKGLLLNAMECFLTVYSVLCSYSESSLSLRSCLAEILKCCM